jgi:hypothetical protein
MRSLVVSVLLIALILYTIRLLRRKKLLNPVSISNGVTYRFPYQQHAKFRLLGLGSVRKFEHFLHSRVTHPSVDHTEVYYDDYDLQASSLLQRAIPPPSYTPTTVTIEIAGNFDPRKVRAYL